MRPVLQCHVCAWQTELETMPDCLFCKLAFSDDHRRALYDGHVKTLHFA